ncbi:MAG: PaaI family thioesterase [Deltaproteobacteria bacterium]|nr:PaaI family thioesterase [Deltaproteobacteria bacterium]MBW2053574.1 PaaI family thioesterase [Deltaproteobacteria bacterium]MBW2142395.1 PaaI family thioesterase [Deltaproteobacteria bacterium]MBW2324202.1 PaaI family thioesterase [Deltaproteobacteria bacterium]
MDIKKFDFLRNEYVQGFPAYCGFEVLHAESGVFEARVKIRPEHRQQDGFVHAGVISTLADHTAGYAAYTIVSEESRILTIEFKINFFKPAIGETVLCRSKIISGGKKIIVSESELFDLNNGSEKLIAKALVTLMTVPSSDLIENQV